MNRWRRARGAGLSLIHISQGCVLVWDENNGVMLTGIHNPYGIERGPVTHWATPPEGPGGGARPWDGHGETR